MDRKALKQRGKVLFGGKDLFEKHYWISVLVTLFMTFNFGAFFTPSVNINFDDLETVFSSNNTDIIQSIFADTFTAGVGFATMISSIFSLVLAILVISTFKAAGIRYFLKYRKNNPTDIKELFQNFKDKTFLNIAKISFCKFGFTYLWTLLFFIPGIVKTYEYWAIDYILATRPDIEREEAFRLSKILTKGHKLDLFVLQFSFFGWDLLSGFTSGILGVFYVAPYKEATFVEFFSDMRLEALAKGLITPYDVPDYEYIAPEYQNPYAQGGFTQENNFQGNFAQGNFAQGNFAQGNYTQSGFTQQYNNPVNPQQPPQNYGRFAQPNQQYNPQYNQPFTQPHPQATQQSFTPPVAPQPPVEAPQENVANNALETEFNPVTPPETQE